MTVDAQVQGRRRWEAMDSTGRRGGGGLARIETRKPFSTLGGWGQNRRALARIGLGGVVTK